jgi:hypothetical protein
LTYDPATDFSECSRLVPERERRLRRAARRARRDLQQILPNGGGVERRRLHCERLHECTPLWVFTLSNCSALRKLVREDAARPRPKTHRKRALLGEEAKASQWHHSGSGGKYLYRAPRSVGGRSDNGLRGDPRAQGAPRGTVSARGARGRGLAARGSKKNHRESRAVGRAAIRTRSGKFLSCPFS